MSSAPCESGPSCDTHARTSYENYTNQGYHASGQAKFSIKQQTTNHQYGGSSPLEELEKHCSHSAAFNSLARFDPPRCAESTRLRIIRSTEEWINGDGHTDGASSLFWLHGGAGVGKSALAQSLSEKFQEKRQLAASFFFFRNDATRTDGARLIPTLVWHLVHSFKGIAPIVEDKIRKNRALFTKNYQMQIRELLVEPLLALKSKGALVTHPRLIVIDGLDKCEKPAVQCELLRVVARAIRQIPYPLRFFITSRSEAHIARVFNHDPDLQAIRNRIRKYNLSDDPDADTDIRKFLEKEFMEIRRVHCLGEQEHLPDGWPGQKAITSLIERSSGHFIYASTVIRYIRSPKHRPDDRLEVILGLRPPQEGDRPYAQLDALYTFVFQGVDDHGHLEKICLVLGILYFRSKGVRLFHGPELRCTIIEDSLGMKAGDLVLLLDPILSLVTIRGGHVRVLHKSLFDYLLDLTRGGHLPIDLSRVHELAATYILKQRIVKGYRCDENTILDFAYHCQYACLNDTLKAYLHSLAAPSPKPVMAALRTFPGWSDRENESMRHTMWHFFRALTREDFDPTGRVYEQYAAKWMGILRSAGPGRTQHQFSKVDNLRRWLKRKLGKPLTRESEVDRLKRELDTLLVEWKPQNFKPIDVRMEPVKLAYIKQEHSAFSAHTKAFFAGQPIFSSLVFSDHFIHSYEVVIGQELFLDLRIYSRHGNACWNYTRHTYYGHHDLIQETLTDLGTIEKHLFSNFFQKYGLVSDDAFRT